MFPLLSHLLFQDRYNPPNQDTEGDPLDGPRCVRGPEAWLEGLRQKGWTLTTILIILIAAYQCDTTASLLGQGDNQVIVLRIPSAHYLEERGLTSDQYTDQFLQVLERVCEESGIVIKIPESWRSRRLLEYGRRYYVDGVMVSGALKKATRLTSEANQAVVTLNTIISGLFSSGASIAGDDTCPSAAYRLTLFEATLALWKRHPRFESMSNEWMTVLLLMNRSVGGYPTVLFPQFALRATQDTLSLGLSVQKHLLSKTLYRDAVHFLLDIKKPEHIDHLQLIKDPGSIPLSIPPQPENLFRRRLKEGLPTIIKNRDMVEVFGITAEEEEHRLKTDLLAIQPVNPKLLCKLWQLSNIGMREKVISKFVTSRSIQNASLGTWVDERALLGSIQALEDRTAAYYVHPKNRASTVTLENTTCVTILTQLLREELWGLHLEGITMPIPADKLLVLPWSELAPSQVPASIMIGWSGTCDKNCHYTRGERTPYIGSQTKVRAKRSALQVMEVGNMIDNVKALLELRSWVKGSEGLRNLLRTLIEEKTHLTLEELEPYTAQVYSGLLSHRLPCPALRRGAMWNGCPNILSWFRIVSDTATNYAKKGTNYNICFQEDFLYGLSVLSEMYRVFGTLPSTIALVIDKTCCVWELPPETFELPLSTYRGLPLMKVIHNLTQVDDRHLVSTSPDTNPRLSYTVHTAHKLAAWIIHVREEEFVTSLENRAIEESVHASFLNLTEFRGVLVDRLIPCFVFYLMLYDRTFLANSLSYFDDVFSPKKTAYDVFLDSLMACGKAGELYALAGVSASGRERDIRSALYLALTQCVDRGYMSVIHEGAFLTPDNAGRLLPRMALLILRVMGEPAPQNLPEDYNGWVNLIGGLPFAIRRNIPIRIVHTEEEAISYVRSVEAPPAPPADGMVVPGNGSGGLPATTGISTTPFILHLSRLHALNQSLCSLLQALAGWQGWTRLAIDRVVVVNDPEGTAFNAVGHIMGMPGYLHWENLSPNSNVWERGPLACATDPCNQWLQTNAFFSSIMHGTHDVVKILRDDQEHRTLVISLDEIPLENLLEWVYKDDEALLCVLSPNSHYVGLDLDDPDWITLPSVTPPLTLTQGAHGSQWILLGPDVEASVVQEEERLACYKRNTPGFSTHLLSVNTVIQWAAPDIRGSLRRERACFNLFQPLAKILTRLPLSTDDLRSLVRSEITTSVNKLRRCITSLDTVGAADKDIVQEYQVRSCDIRVRVGEYRSIS